MFELKHTQKNYFKFKTHLKAVYSNLKFLSAENKFMREKNSFSIY